MKQEHYKFNLGCHMHCFFFLAIMKYPTKSSLKKKVHLGLWFEVIPFFTEGWRVTSRSVVVREYGTHTLTSQRVRDRESEEEQIYSPPQASHDSPLPLVRLLP